MKFNYQMDIYIIWKIRSQLLHKTVYTNWLLGLCTTWVPVYEMVCVRLGRPNTHSTYDLFCFLRNSEFEQDGMESEQEGDLKTALWKLMNHMFCGLTPLKLKVCDAGCGYRTSFTDACARVDLINQITLYGIRDVLHPTYVTRGPRALT